MSKNKRAIIIIGLAVLLLMSPLIFNQQALLGVDGYFQYSRIYEAAMQLKNHNISFINIYSFQQAGRIVNSLYSPLITYLAGAVLLLVGTWYRFQLVSVFLVYFISGYVTYHAARRFQLSQRLSLALGLIFLSSNAVYGFIFGVTWRSIAFGLLPIFIGPMLDLYKGDWRLPAMLKLGIYIGILAQFQVLTVALLLPFLLPFFVRGLWHSSLKLKALLNLVAAVLLVLLLSLNALLPLLEVYRGNTLIPPVAMDMMSNTSLILQPIYNGVDSNSDIVITVIVYAMVMGLIMFWSRLHGFTKLLAVVALCYTIAGTSLIPWDLIQKNMPYLQSFLQMPRRISLVGTPFLIVAAALIYHDAARSTESVKFQKGLVFASLFLGLLSLLLCTQKVVKNVHRTLQPTTSLASGLQTADNNVHSKLTHFMQLQPAFHTHDLSKLIREADRTTPDYIPITHKVETHANVYGAYLKKFSAQKHKFSYRVMRAGVQLTWTAKRAKTRSVPVVAYRRSTLTLNGKPLTHQQMTHNWVGDISIKQHRGRNVLTVRYTPSRITTLGTNVTLGVWLVVILVLIQQGFNRLRHRRLVG
ncbi:hypothetical protein C5Z26_02270 [Lactobacillus sp. CBA3606]|uniref:hypothetical protein n=1 Tax=Lactobacillus sp. CBA3606 TaxID=2099789 RepID=UPI000CFBDE5F|nr:hypothetical protein [Lactobacillus sp. CBA3606]AVK63019.1 hypothetical protein C5Z26_02270 [Lactobacillus sp. CBA3606]